VAKHAGFGGVFVAKDDRADQIIGDGHRCSGPQSILEPGQACRANALGHQTSITLHLQRWLFGADGRSRATEGLHPAVGRHWKPGLSRCAGLTRPSVQVSDQGVAYAGLQLDGIIVFRMVDAHQELGTVLEALHHRRLQLEAEKMYR